MAKEIEIQDLPTVATNDIPFESLLPIGIRNTNKEKYNLFKITLKQLEIRLFHIQVETIWNAFEKDPALTNIIFQLQDNIITINYDETKLNELSAHVNDNIVPLLERIRTAITNLDTGDLYNLHDEITRINQAFIDLEELFEAQINAINDFTTTAITNIQNQLQEFIDNFSGFNAEVITFPTLKNPALGYQNTNNFNDFEPIYSYTVSQFQNKIVVYILLKNQADINFRSAINFYNFKNIFPANGNEIIEVEFLIKSADKEFSLYQFLNSKTIRFFPATTNQNPILTVTTDNLPSNIAFTQQLFTFTAIFNKNGFIGFNSFDSRNIATTVELNSVHNQILSESVTNTQFDVIVDGTNIIYQYNNIAFAKSFIILPEEEILTIETIFVQLGFCDVILEKYTVEFSLPFHKIAAPEIEVTLYLLSNKEGEIIKKITIPNNKKDNQVIITLEYYLGSISYVYLFELDNQKTSINFEIDYTKFNNANDLTVQIPEHSKDLILNINLKDPFLLAEGLLPDYFKPNIVPQQSEDLIAVFLNSQVGSLDVLETITINLITGDTKGFFKYFAYGLTPNSMPANFDNNLSTIFFPIVSLGGHTEVTEVSNVMSSTSTYYLEMKKKDNKKYLSLISSSDNDNIYFEKQRKKQFQTMLQSFATKLLNTTLYFQSTISSNRSGLNLNFFNPNPEYNGSDVSAYVPIRETEYVFNGYLRLDILNDKYQNTQALTDYYFIKAELHFVDYYCINNVIHKRISNEATYDFDEKQSRTILIFVNNLTDATKDFFFNLDLVFGLRQNEDCDFWIRVINRDVPVKLIDLNPSLQVAPNLSYGVQYSSTDANFVYEKKFTINRTVTTAPLDVKTQKFTFAVRLSSDINKCQEIPYDPMIFVTTNQLANYPTLAEVQALIVNIVAGGTIDLTEYAKLTDLQATQNQINNYVVANFATKNDLQTTNTNLNTTNTNLTNLTNNLQNNYYNKTDSNDRFALKTNLETQTTNLENTTQDVQNIREQYLLKNDAIATYETIATVKTNKTIAQPSIFRTTALTEKLTYKEIPQSAKLIEITVNPKQIRDNYIGYLDKDYEIDDPVVFHFKVNVELDNNAFINPQVFSTFGQFEPLGTIENGEYLVDFLCHNSWNSTFRTDLRGSILGKINPNAYKKWIGSGVKLVSNYPHGEHYQYVNSGPFPAYMLNSSTMNDDTGYVQAPNTTRYIGAFLLEQGIGADNIGYAKHSALATGQIPINICFALKTHRPIYFEINNPLAPQVNVTLSCVTDKENEFAWIQQPIDYQNSRFLIFTELISKPIPNNIKYITDEFKTAGLRYKNSDPNCQFTANYNNTNFDTYQCPTVNSVLAYTMSVFPDFYRMPIGYTTFFESTRFRNCYLNHPSNFHYYIIMNYKNLIYRTEQKDYLSYSSKYDGRTIDLSSILKFVGARYTGGYLGGGARDVENSLLAQSACLSHSIIQGSIETIRQEFRRVAFKYIVRKNFSQFAQRIMSWADNVVYFDSQAGSDAEQKAIASIKPNGCILYVEPDPTTPLDEKLTQWFNAPYGSSNLNTEGNNKILDLAKTYNEQAKTKWIEINLRLTPSPNNSGRSNSPISQLYLGAHRTFAQNNVWQGEFIDTAFAVLDKLPDDINFINR